MVKRIIRYLLIGLLATSVSGAQESRGNLAGRVTDTSGAVVGGAQIQVMNTQTGVTIPTQTNDQGLFTVPFLIPSVYSVTVEHSGFKRLVRGNVLVLIDSNVQLDVSLTVGEVSQQVEVTAAPPLLNTVTPSLGTVLETKHILDLANAGGGVAEMAALAPGVAQGGGIAIHYAPFTNGTSRLVSNGGSLYANEWYFDGIPNMFASGTQPRIGFNPPPMMISEFKSMTVYYDASLGHTSGAIFNMDTRSGTNQYHGELHEYVANNILNANYAFNGGQPLAHFNDNRYGGAIGGPVFLPHLYNGNKGTKKTFFYYVYERHKFTSPDAVGYLTVPTAAERTGDFSALLSIDPSYQIYNPFSTTAAGDGVYQRTAFANNVIPTGLLSSTALNIMKLIPLPNAPGTTDGFNNYLEPLNLNDTEDVYAHFGRVDHTFSDRSRMFLRIDYDKWVEEELSWFGYGNPTSGNKDGRTDIGVALDEVYVLNPSTIFDFRYGLTAQEFPNEPLSPTSLPSLGFSPGFNALFPSKAPFPFMTFSDGATYTQFGDFNGLTLVDQSSLIHSFLASVTQQLHSHGLHYGVDFRLERANQRPFSPNTASMNFDSTYTNGPFSTSPASAIGQDLASFELGIPGTGGVVQTNSSYADSDHYFGFYLQDDWRATPRLTLNFGFRLDHETPEVERYNRAVVGFDNTAPNPIGAAATANYAVNPIPGLPVTDFHVNGGLLFAGGQNGRSFWSGQAVEAMPRIGFAYQVTPKTVIRGGYGIFYDTIGIYRSPAIQNGFSSVTPVNSSLNNGVGYVASMADPVPNGVIPPLGAAGGLSTALGQPLSVYARSRSIPYAQRYSLNVEREITSDFVLDVSYVGNIGGKLPVSTLINNTPASYLSTSPTRDQAVINALGTVYPNPFNGLAPSYTQTTTVAQLVTPYPEFGQITETTDIGRSNYNSLQVQLQKRFTHGYSIGIAYTFSRLMDAINYLNNTDPLPWYGVSAYDRPNVISVSNLFTVPVGRGKMIGSTMPKAIDYVAGGWQVNTIVSYQSGDALTWGDVLFNGNPSKVRLSASQRNLNHWFNTAGFNTSSADQLADNIRTFPLRLSNVRGDGQDLWNVAVLKDIPIHENLKLELRGEAYNALNHVNLTDPNTSPTSGSFGEVSGQNGNSRTVQVALRLLF